MASPSCPLYALPRSTASNARSVNASPKKPLGGNFQIIHRPKCFKRFLSKCAIQLRGSKVAVFKSRLDFCQVSPGRQILEGKKEMKKQTLNFSKITLISGQVKLLLSIKRKNKNDLFWRSCALSVGTSSWFSFCQVAESSIGDKTDLVYEIGELFELGIQISYLLILLGLLGLGTFYVIRQVLVRRELDLSAKDLQEQVRSGDATATEYFELGAVMLRRKFYPAAIKYLQQAIDKWDRDDQDLAQVYNALGVSYVRENKLEKGIEQFKVAVKLQPGYVTAWNNMGDAYEKKKDLRSALKAFEEVLLFDPNNKVARPRRDALRERVRLFKGVPLKSEER